jgi:NAD+ diphosphatase
MPVIAALQNDDSMLTRRFGKEVINYYSGSRLNRYSFLRADRAFLRRAAATPATRYIALNNLSGILVDKSTLATFPIEDVKALVGAQPFDHTEEEYVKQFDSTVTRPPLVVFLGMLDAPAQGAADGVTSESVEVETTDHGSVTGQPYFAVDVTPRGSYTDAANAFEKLYESKGWSVEKNPRAMALAPDAGKQTSIASP